MRRQFLLDRRYIQMSQFFLASHPQPVRAAIEAHRRGLDENPFLYVEENIERFETATRQAASEHMGCQPDDLAMTDSTSMGLGIFYGGLQLKEGQEILSTTHDHPASFRAEMTPGGFHSFEHRWALADAFRFHAGIGKARIAKRIHAQRTVPARARADEAHRGGGAAAPEEDHRRRDTVHLPRRLRALRAQPAGLAGGRRHFVAGGARARLTLARVSRAAGSFFSGAPPSAGRRGACAGVYRPSAK